jgi:hypothetical protein
VPIRTMPFDKIGIEDITALIERRIREDRTLEFKEAFDLGDSGKVDFLADVTAMANASGGTIVYGVVEGEGDDRGFAVGLKPMMFAADERERQVANQLRDGVQERIPGVLHRAMAYEGGYLYVVRIPASRLAPHMITVKTQRPRFYLRPGAVNEPMDVQQIKEVVLRSQGAEERAIALIDQRTAHFTRRQPNLTITKPGGGTVVRAAAQVLLHVVPLFPPREGLDLADGAILHAFESVPPFFSDEPASDHRMSLDGYMNCEWNEQLARPDRSVLLLRRGALEFHLLDAVEHRTGGAMVLDAVELERAVLGALTQASRMADAGLVLPPALVSLRLLRVAGTTLVSESQRLKLHTLSDGDLLLEPLFVNDWLRELDTTARHLFDVVWQAYGFRRCQHYDTAGRRIV